MKVGILRWNAPGWVNSNDKVYTWYKNTILARTGRTGSWSTTSIPGLNESAADLTWTKQYANRVRTDTAGFNSAAEQALYNAIKVVISDEVGVGLVRRQHDRATPPCAAPSRSPATTTTPTTTAPATSSAWPSSTTRRSGTAKHRRRSAIPRFAPTTTCRTPSVAGTGIGGINSPLEMGNTIIKGFVNSRRTHFIYQPAIGSFYEGGQYSFKELLSARDPWSGWMHYDAGLDVLAALQLVRQDRLGEPQQHGRHLARRPQSSYTGATGTNPVADATARPATSRSPRPTSATSPSCLHERQRVHPSTAAAGEHGLLGHAGATSCGRRARPTPATAFNATT